MLRALALATALILPMVGQSQDAATAPRLGVATNFGQG